MQLQHVIKLKLSSQLIGQFGHVTASASCKQPEKHGKSYISRVFCPGMRVDIDMLMTSLCLDTPWQRGFLF